MDSNILIAGVLRAGVYISGAFIAVGLALGMDEVIRAGIFILIAAPLIVVGILGIRFAMERKWRWTGTAVLILAAIAASAILGIRD